MALAAVVLIAVYSGWMAANPRGDSADENSLATQLKPSEAEVQVDLRPISASWSAGGEVMRRVSSGTRSLLAKTSDVPVWVTPSGQAEIASNTRQQIRRAKQRISGSFRQFVSALAELPTEPAHADGSSGVAGTSEG